MTTITAVGECLMELTHHGAAQLAIRYAGDTYNTSVYLRRLTAATAKVQYITAVGDDWYSDQLLASAAAEHIEVCAPQIPSGTPGVYLVRVDSAGERTFTYHRTGSPATTMFGSNWPDELTNQMVSSDLVYLSAITLQILAPDAREELWATLARVQGRGGIVAFDSNYREAGWPSREAAKDALTRTLPLVDIALPSLADERALFGDEDALTVIARYTAAGASQVVVKDGTHPTISCHSGELFMLQPPTVQQPVDTTGAGDSFNAGYLAGTLAGATPQQSVRLAQRVAAQVVQFEGAIIPRRIFRIGVTS